MEELEKAINNALGFYHFCDITSWRSEKGITFSWTAGYVASETLESKDFSTFAECAEDLIKKFKDFSAEEYSKVFIP